MLKFAELGSVRMQMRGRTIPTECLLRLRLRYILMLITRQVLLLIQLASLPSKKYMSFTTCTLWETDFGVRYAKSQTQCPWDKVHACAGKPLQSNSRSKRCGCTAMMWLLRSDDNGSYGCEHRIASLWVMILKRVAATSTPCWR